MSSQLLVVDDAVKHFPLPRRGLRRREHVHSLDGITLRVNSGEVFGLVGESGSGKSTLARVILGLTPTTSGQVSIDGLGPRPPRKQLARTAQLIFQDPHAAMDPRMTLGVSLTAVLAQHRIGSKEERAQAVSHALAEVGLDDTYLHRYPGECSGGQLQRVVIARALLLRPKLLICDEPTSALDASVQARILNLLRRLQGEHGLAMIVISHDLRVVRYLGDRVAVMYLGQIVEIADRDDIYERSCHPYTLALLAAGAATTTGKQLPATVTGEPPSPIHPPSGCRFHPRCPLATPECRSAAPELREITPGHQVRCHHWETARTTLASEESPNR
ncbi:ABC transporter ATP-binding protein [Nonomuraea sp. NPDC026600]|uniref:ABC transporter ATP-binding protein n=1 Tax=Nonomuraea sp. NPDC026600 TaxID=3155363 RepID=UPI0033DB24BC